jgi:hypothetical protein
VTTLAEITLQVAKQIAEVTEGAATAGSATTLTDTFMLTQPNGYFDRGTVWIRSGAHAGKVAEVTGFTTNKLTFATLGSTLAANDRYAVARAQFPYKIIRQCINQALEETHVTGDDNTLVGDGVSLEYTLPVGVQDVVRVEYENPTSGYRTLSNHWQERGDALLFDYGYPPYEGDVIHVIYKKLHDELVDYDDEISPEINTHWLKWKASENALRWALRVYQNDPQLNVITFLNEALQKTQILKPRREPFVRVRTAGG